MRTRQGLILQHGLMDPPALLGDWLERERIGFDVCETWHTETEPDLAERDFLVVLGSAHSATQDDPPWIPIVRATIDAALSRELPVLGICFGAQALALALGGEVFAASEPEVGWRSVETDDPAVIPPGPWLHWHFEAFTVPEQGKELARSASCVQAFSAGRHLALQFHPEATPEIAEAWADQDRERLQELGIDDSEYRRAEDHRDLVRAAADSMFASWWRLAFGGLDGSRAQRSDG